MRKYLNKEKIISAKDFFEMTEEKDIVTWTTMLDDYAKLGEHEAANQVLYSLYHVYANILLQGIAFSLPINRMGSQRRLCLYIKIAKPDQITLVSTLLVKQ